MYGRGAKSIAEQLFGTPKNKKEEEENTEKAKVIKENVYKAFPKIRTFEEDSVKKVKEHGYVSTLWGRRRRLPNYNLPPIQMFYVYKDNNGNETKLEDLSVVNPAKYTEILGKYSSCGWGQRDKYAEDLENKEGIRIINNNSKIAAAGRQIINSQVQGSAADMSKMALVKIHNDEELIKRKVKIIIPVHDEILIETPLRYAKYVKDRFAEDMMTAARPKLTIPVSCDVESSDRWYGETMDLDEVLKGLEGV